MKDELKPPKTQKDSTIHPSSFIPHPLTEGEDFYWEGAAMVFTARFHLRRGHCCGNGCRHCPFGGSEADASAPVSRKENVFDERPEA